VKREDVKVSKKKPEKFNPPAKTTYRSRIVAR
jgi:hypothetical protein